MSRGRGSVVPLALLILAAWTLGLHPGRAAGQAGAKVWTVLLTADKAAYTPGEPITLTLRVVNETGKPVTLAFRTSQRFDFAVRDQAGREVWRWGAARMFIQVLGSETVLPSGALLYTARVEKQLSPGAYTATGIVTAHDGNLAATVALNVEVRP